MKNLYDDAMGDAVLSRYLPSREQLSGKLPERDFFFGVVCTLRRQYMADIIAAAHKKRFQVPEDDQSKQGILITDAWMDELMKHPYHSSKFLPIILTEKPGTAIFLMKERAKVYKAQSNRVKHELSKRLQPEEEKLGELFDDASGPQKKKKGADGGAIPVHSSSQQPLLGASKPK